jgi:hypothetical protein
MAKQLNPNSGRQIIIKVLYDNGGSMTPAAISAKLKEDGNEIKYLHSHLNYFKTHGQILHNEDKTYKISKKMVERLDELYVPLDTEMELVVEEANMELVEA